MAIETKGGVNAALGVPALKPRGTTGYSQEVIDLNGSGLQERRRTNPSGKTKSRYSVEIVSEPLLHIFDDQLLGERPARAIAEVIRAKIRGISANASTSTILFRESAKAALAKGKRWAVNRYTKGRLKGDFTPGKSDKLFNDSGRLSLGVEVRENRAEKNWVVNVPANRLDPATFRTKVDMIAMFERLQSFVPELGNPAALARHASVRDAITGSLEQLIRKAEAINLEKRRELRRAVARLFTGGGSAALEGLFF